MAGEDKAFLKLLPNPRVPSVLTPAEGQQHLGAGFATAPLHLQQAKGAQSESMGVVHRGRVVHTGQGGSNIRGIRYKGAMLDGEQVRRAAFKTSQCEQCKCSKLGAGGVMDDRQVLR